MVDLTYRARSILEIWLRHKPETAVWFWKVLIDEDGHIWASPDDEDIALLVETGFLGPSGPCKPSDFLRGVAKDVGLKIRSGRAWSVSAKFREMAA